MAGATRSSITSLRRFGPLFSPNDWELKNPKILATDSAKLLFQAYHNAPDGHVEITKCTIIFPYSGPAADADQRLRQSVILQAPEGATLQFDQPLDISQGKVSRLVKGRLNGRVTIRSDWKEPGPEDDLLVETSDIELTERTISTPQPVSFRWGPHFGHGRNMMIKLSAGSPKPGMERSATDVNGIDSFELQQVEQLHLDLGRGRRVTGRPPDGHAGGDHLPRRVPFRRRRPRGYLPRCRGRGAAQPDRSPGSSDL